MDWGQQVPSLVLPLTGHMVLGKSLDFRPLCLDCKIETVPGFLHGLLPARSPFVCSVASVLSVLFNPVDCSPPDSSVPLGAACSMVLYEELPKCESHMIWSSISESSSLLLLCIFKGKGGGCGKSDLGGWLHHAGQVRDCRRSLPGCPGPAWEGPQGGREGEGKQATVHFPMVVFGARPSQALVLGWRPRSPHGLTSSRGNWGFSFVRSIHWPEQ